MNRITGALTAVLFLFIATAGSASAGGNATTQPHKVRQQNVKQLQKNMNSDGTLQVRQRKRTGY